jgi:hypothetical protein
LSHEAKIGVKWKVQRRAPDMGLLTPVEGMIALDHVDELSSRRSRPDSIEEADEFALSLMLHAVAEQATPQGLEAREYGRDPPLRE